MGFEKLKAIEKDIAKLDRELMEMEMEADEMEPLEGRWQSNAEEDLRSDIERLAYKRDNLIWYKDAIESGDAVAL